MDEGRGGPEFDGTFVLAVPPEPDQVRTARLFAAAIARHFGADEDRVEDLKVAVSEAATNSIKAHRQGSVSESIRIEAAAEADGLRFSVIDSGPGFQADAAAGGDSDATPVPGLFEGSLGLTVIRSLFPDVRIARNEAQGMTVTFLLETLPRPAVSELPR